MKNLALCCSLLGAFCLAAPATGWSKDKHHHHNSGYRDHGSSHRYHQSGHNHHHGSYRYSPSYYRSYRPYYYPSYGYYPYSYYSGPSIGFTYTSTPTYYRDSRSSDYDDDLAVDVQRALARRGFYRGSIDGDVGPGTRGAIREYQYRHGLEVTGRIDRSLLRSLGLS